MKHKSLIIGATIFITILLAYAGIKPFAAATAVGLTTSDDVSSAVSEMPAPSELAADESCAQPAPAKASACLAREQEILAATVRIMMVTTLMPVEGAGYLILNGNGHGTIKDGRYLVTHNHYNETVFALLQQGDPNNQVTINVYNANGGIILQVPAQSVSVVAAAGQISILDFGTVNGVGIFNTLGVPSAPFAANEAMPLQAGLEVAQIDWDGATAHVNWVTVAVVFTASGVAAVKLDHCIRQGASGGGLYWQGVHYGNNWSRSNDCELETAPLSAQYSFVALNS